MKISYSVEDRRRAVAEYRRVKSVTKAVRNLGYPARRTLYDWIRYGIQQRKPKHTHLLEGNRRYPWQLKLQAVELFEAGYRPKEIQERLDLTTFAIVYDWARRFRESGEWGLMSKRERDQHRDLPTQAALEASLPNDPEKLRKLAAQLLVDKAVLEQELSLVKKDVSVTVGELTNRQKTQIVDALRSHLPLAMLLASIGLSSSSFYYQRQAAAAPDKYASLRKHIAATAKASHFTYGYRRIWWSLRHAGVRVSEKVIRRLMAQDQIPVHGARNKRKWTSYQGELTPAPPNLVQRNFHAERPCQLWLTDITEFSAGDGKVYLSAMIDCFDGKVVGAKTGRAPVMELAEDTLTQALEDHPGATTTPLVVHSDRGGHYRSRGWIRRTQTAGITRSMSKKGYTPDNAACEGFFGRMKNEMYYGRRWTTCDDLETAIHAYIDFYNTSRIKVSLGGYSIQAYRILNQLESELS